MRRRELFVLAVLAATWLPPAAAMATSAPTLATPIAPPSITASNSPSTAAHLRRIRPMAVVLWGVTAALGASILGCGLGSLAASDAFAGKSYVGAAPPAALVSEGEQVFRLALSTDILGIFAISAAVGAVVLTVTGYGPAAHTARRY